jgi:hypothetical protein
LFENKALRKLFGLKKDEVEYLVDLYYIIGNMIIYTDHLLLLSGRLSMWLGWGRKGIGTEISWGILLGIRPVGRRKRSTVTLRLRFKVLIRVFWDVAQCSFVETDRHFRGT